MVGDSPRILAIAHPAAVVLQSAVDVIRPVHVETDVIELRDRQVVFLPPPMGTVVADPQSAVVSLYQMIGVQWIDPDVVEVAVSAAAHIAQAVPAVVAGNQG